MRLRVDAARCTGHGRCYTLSPELLECDDNGYVTVKGDEVDVPDGLEDAARRARGSCPEDAIALID